MKIAFVLGHELPFPPAKGGGVNSLLHSLTRAMVKVEGVTNVTVYSPLFDGAAEREICEGVIHRRVKGTERQNNALSNVILGIPYVLRVRNSLEPCDVLNSHTLHTFLFSVSPPAKVITHTMHRDPKKYLVLYKNVNRIYTGSEAVSEQAAKVAPLLSEKLLTIHNCVDYNGYDLAPKPPGPDFTFLFIGRFTEDKGLRSFIKGFLKAAEENSRIRLATVGPQKAEEGAEPDFFSEISKHVAASPYANRIELRRPIFNPAKLEQEVRKADCICLPSLGGETLNMGVLEAMRLSKPLLVSDLEANRPLVDETYGNGLVVKKGDAEDWARAMLVLTNRRADQISAMAEKSYTFGRERFSSEVIASRYVEDYRKLLKARPA